MSPSQSGAARRCAGAIGLVQACGRGHPEEDALPRRARPVRQWQTLCRGTVRDVPGPGWRRCALVIGVARGKLGTAEGERDGALLGLRRPRAREQCAAPDHEDNQQAESGAHGCGTTIRARSDMKHAGAPLSRWIAMVGRRVTGDTGGALQVVSPFAPMARNFSLRFRRSAGARATRERRRAHPRRSAPLRRRGGGLATIPGFARACLSAEADPGGVTRRAMRGGRPCGKARLSGWAAAGDGATGGGAGTDTRGGA